jgi:hypoxanthine phosphoribosyltransferase
MNDGATKSSVSRLAAYKAILYTAEQVDTRIAEMAREIVRMYGGLDVVFVSLLNGAQPFASKLMFAIQRQDPSFNPNVQSMIVSRYGPNREPGKLRIVTDLPPEYRELTGRRAVIIDDLIDGGGTTEYSKQHLLAYGADEVDLIVLVKKIKEPAIQGKLALYGFTAPDVWLTGMGMDDSQRSPEANRWAEWIAIANH